VWLKIKDFKTSTRKPSHTLPRRGTDFMALRSAFQMTTEKWKMINDK